MPDGAGLLPILVCLSVVNSAVLVRLLLLVDEAGIAAIIDRITALRKPRRGRDHL